MKKLLIPTLIFALFLSSCGKPAPLPSAAPADTAPPETPSVESTEPAAPQASFTAEPETAIPEFETDTPEEPTVISVSGDTTVIFLDADGNGVAGVEILVCSETLCSLMKSDADGKVDIHTDEAVEIHIQSLPEGCLTRNIIYTMEDGKVLVYLG